jgi:hypothetical protein
MYFWALVHAHHSVLRYILKLVYQKFFQIDGRMSHVAIGQFIHTHFLLYESRHHLSVRKPPPPWTC